MARPCSLDLREHVGASVDGGRSRRETAVVWGARGERGEVVSAGPPLLAAVPVHQHVEEVHRLLILVVFKQSQDFGY